MLLLFLVYQAVLHLSPGGTVYRFEPPTVEEPVLFRGFGYVKQRFGITVLQEGSSFRQLRYPSDEELSAGTQYWRGGYIYYIDGATADLLTEHGYGEYLTEISDPVDNASYGTFGLDGIGKVYYDDEELSLVDGPVVTGIDSLGRPYVDFNGVTPGEEASVSVVDGQIIFTRDFDLLLGSFSINDDNQVVYDDTSTAVEGIVVTGINADLQPYIDLAGVTPGEEASIGEVNGKIVFTR